MKTSNKHFILAISIVPAIFFALSMTTDVSAKNGVETANPTNLITDNTTVQVNNGSGVEPDRAAFPSRDDLGDILEGINVDEGTWAGMTWDGELMWCVDYEGFRMFGVNPQGQVVERVDLPCEELGVEGFWSLCWDGEVFWAGCEEIVEMFRFDRAGNFLGCVEVPGEGEGGVSSITFDGENLWYWIPESGALLRQVTPDGELLREVDCSQIGLHEEGSDYWALEWVPEHVNSNMWALVGEEGFLCQLNLREDEAEVVDEIEIEQEEVYGLCHDGTNLWFPTCGEWWFVMDDGIEEAEAPGIVIEPNAVEDNLNTGDIAEHVINVSNFGEGMLRFEIDHEILNEPGRDRRQGPERDDPGDILAQYQTPVTRTSGLAWDEDNGWMWGLNHRDPDITYAVDPANGDIVANFESEHEVGGMFYLDGVLFQGGYNDAPETIFRYDTEGNALEEWESPAFLRDCFIASDGEHLMVASGWNSEVYVFGLDDLEEVATIDFSEEIEEERTSVEWVSAHPEGQLWLSGESRLYQCFVDEEWNCELVQDFATRRGDEAGLGHDGDNLWRSGPFGDQSIYVIDDGVEEVFWLSYEPDEGELEPDEDWDVVITLNATDCIEGEYEADLHFYSNDQVNNDVVVAVLMNVTGVPLIDVEWSDEIGYPDEINWNDAFEDLFTGGPYPVPVTVRNAGSAELVVEEITCENRTFSADPAEFVLAPDERLEVDFILDAEEDGVHEAEMVIVWNSPDGEDVIIPLSGETAQPPEIVVMGEIEGDLNSGEMEEFAINVANEGEAELRFTVEHEIISEPERDKDQRAVRHIEAIGPCRDELGDIIDAIEIGEGYWIGLAWDGDLMWGVDCENGIMISVNPDGEIIDEVDLPADELGIEGEGFTGLCWDGEAFWMGCFEFSELFRVDTEGNLIDRIELPEDEGEQGAFGVAWDGEFLWYIICEGDGILRQITVEGELVREVDCGEIECAEELINIEWVPQHTDGHMWWQACDEGYLCQLNVEGEEAEIIQETEIEQSEHFGLGHDGDNLWYQTSEEEEGIWFIMDDGIEEIYWLTYDPDEGEIETGADMEIIVTLNATGCVEGDYEAIIHILSNDPANPDVEVPVLMSVAGAPAIEVTWSEELGYPDVIDWNEGFEDLFMDVGYEVPVVVENIGTSGLIVDGIFCEDEAFTSNPDEMIIEPGEDLEILFIFNSEDDEAHESEMRIDWNSPDGEDFMIPVMADPTEPPVIFIDPEEMEVFLESGDEDEQAINVSNEGDALLRLSIDHEIIAEPGDDRINRSVRSVDAANSNGAPERDDPGDILAEHRIQWDMTIGLAWDDDNGWMWGLRHRDPGRVFAYDPEEGEIVVDFPGRREVGGMFYLDGVLYIGGYGDNPNDIFRYDIDGNELERWDSPRDLDECFIASDGENLLISCNPQRAVSVYDLENLEEIARIDFREAVNNDNTWSIEWVNDHPDGQLWISGRERLYQCFVDENWNCEPVQDFGTVAGTESGIGHDGTNLWRAPFVYENTRWYVIDDGVTESHWLTYDPDETELGPGENADIIVVLDASGVDEGDYEADLVFSSNDPENPNVVVPIVMHVGVFPEHFADFVAGEESHLISVTDLFFEGEDAPEGWEIGVFTPGGVLSGAVVWQEDPVEFNAYCAADGRDQFEEGDRLNFRIWDNEAEMEFAASPEIEEGPATWIADGFTELSLDAVGSREIRVLLDAGWNMISINVSPQDEELWVREEGPDIRRMLEQLRIDEEQHHIQLFKDGNGRFYTPAFGFNNIPYWNLFEGYQANVDEDVEAVWTGEEIPADTDVPLNMTWNLIAYLPTYELDASSPDFYVLSPIIDFVFLAKDVDGRFMSPQFNFSNMPPWRETQGYQVKIESDDPIILNYPPEQEGLACQDESAVRCPQRESAVRCPHLTENTGENMSVLVTSINGIRTNAGDQIGAFNSDGRIVGVGTIYTDGRCGLAVWGDDPLTDEVDGLLEGEVFELRLLDSGQNLLIESIQSGQGLVYKTDEFTVLDVAVETSIPTEFYLTQAYPNPFNSTTIITYGLPVESNVSLNLYDLSGRLIQTLIEGKGQAGVQTTILNAANLPSGLYFVRLSASAHVFTRKVMLVR